jgi:hypothetical protein
MRNTAELEAVMQYIGDHPEEWDQEMWWCESTACFAGHVAARNGCHLNVTSPHPYRLRSVMTHSPCYPRLTPLYDQVVDDPARKPITVREYARDVLGLTDEEADLLFSGSNELEDLQHIVKGLVNGDTCKFIRAGL